MKKIALLTIFAAISIASHGQVTLTGSSYTQNFDGIGTSLPTGWSVYSGAASNFLGSIATFNTSTSYFPSVLVPDTPSTCLSGVLVGGFKNYPSADVLPNAGTDFCGTPPTYTNRALGVRQVSPTNVSHPNLDSGAAFVLKITNTLGLTNFVASFNLQSLDTSSPRITTWLVDYAIGSSTTFTPVTTTKGIFTTGGHLFSNNPDTVNFGSALDNSGSTVTIRIVTLVYSSGSGNRASSAIDDFHLSWSATPTAGVTNVSEVSDPSLTVLGTATPDKINLQYNSADDANYTLGICDMTGRMIHTENIPANSGIQQISVNGLHLSPGMYIAKLANSSSSSVTRVMIQ